MLAVICQLFVRFVSVAVACLLTLIGTGSSVSAANVQLHTSDKYVQYQPNELGRVPVMMYHNIVSPDAPRDPTVDEYMYRTYDQLWNDMLWLHEHDFHLIGMNDLISGNIDIPIGKHPVVVTFDDSSSLHFSMYENGDTELEIDPNCAIGIMERFYAEYPEFGRGAHFGVVPAHKFSWPQHEQDELFDLKIEWLMDNGYEVGNHTLSHPNLAEIDDENFAWTVSGPVIWADGIMGADHPSNATRVLTLPFGIEPKPEDNPTKVAMMEQGFEYEGSNVRLIGVLELTGGSSEVPWSIAWDPYSIPRLPVQDDVLEILKTVHLEGDAPYYTSDGNVDTVTIPWPLPQSQVGKFDSHAVEASGKTIVKYYPASGRIFRLGQIDEHHVYHRHQWLISSNA